MREWLQRLWRHHWARPWQTLLPEAALQRLTAQTAQAEARHSGEVRICIESRLPLSYLRRPQPLKAVVRARAVAQFGKLRVWDTEHNNGVLIYLLLAERAIELVADRGIDRCVTAAQWQSIVDALRTQLQQGAYEAGLSQALDAVCELLSTHFPLQAGQANPNELPDRPDAH